jgi:hypothetical protein
MSACIFCAVASQDVARTTLRIMAMRLCRLMVLS